MFCWFFKLLISHNLDNKAENSRFVKKHIASCKDCARFYNLAKGLESKLIQDAEKLQAGAFSGFVDTAQFAQAAEADRHTLRIKPGLLAVAACLVIALIFSAVFNIQKAEEAKRLKQERTQETLRFALSTHSLVTDRIVTSDSTARLVEVMSTPYKNEIETIKNGTRTALRFLVSCVDVNIDDNQKKTITN